MKPKSEWRPFPYPTLVRFEWVKMFYPDAPEGTIVGVVHAAVPLSGGPPTWVLDHRTVDTQSTATSPMGIDVGTVKYLSTLTMDLIPPPTGERKAITEVHYLPHGSPTMYVVPFAEFQGLSYRTSMTAKGELRTRMFMPTDRWTPMKPYDPIQPAFWHVTWINEDGSVIYRHIPRT